MTVSCIIGAQWGDEGKGKIVDLLASTAKYVVRFNGGNNAGHTIKNSQGTFKLHLVPSGIFYPEVRCIIGTGVVIDLENLIQEINGLKEAGISFQDRFFISPRAHLIMPYHKLLDALYEEAKGKGSTGTTGRGIGPVYADKVSYNGLRIADLADPAVFKEKLAIQITIKNKIIPALGGQPIDGEAVLKEYLAMYEVIAPYVREPFTMLQQAIDNHENILLEGAQGTMLDPDWGTYPFSTASSPLSSSTASGAGIHPRLIDKIMGVTKAYSTRVGNGPMPTELNDDMGENIRRLGGEFGTTTGRARRCGWFDAVSVRFATRMNAFTDIILTKLDVLDSFPTVKICTGYRLVDTGEEVDYTGGDSYFLERCEPIYEELPGWQCDISHVRSFAELPTAARNYINRLEELIGVKISLISTGPDREQTIER